MEFSPDSMESWRRLLSVLMPLQEGTESFDCAQDDRG